MIGMTKTMDGMNEFMQQQGALFGICLCLTIVFEIMLFCCKNMSRRVPINYILLSLFTICEAVVLSFVCSFYPTNVVVSSAAMTAGITFTCTLYAFRSSNDFTIMGGSVWILSLTIFMMCILGFIFPFGHIWHLLIAGLCVFLFGIFLIYDVQVVAGGGHF
mmetsp:Transcript_55756/g.76749  ORF Transcript_55756/g.76749 Transcript_55756/m.76749 type:complete len:161 (-) Transcript_55756:177-659(-)